MKKKIANLFCWAMLVLSVAALFATQWYLIINYTISGSWPEISDWLILAPQVTLLASYMGLTMIPQKK